MSLEDEMQNVNEIFADFASRFVTGQRGGGDVAFVERLKRNELDYALQSLNAVDDYLAILHAERQGAFLQGWSKTILWAGAYLGEVIRRNASREYNWTDFDEFTTEFPQSAQLLGSDRQLANTALLTFGNGGFTLPINKVLKFIDLGREESTWFYASCELRQIK